MLESETALFIFYTGWVDLGKFTSRKGFYPEERRKGDDGFLDCGGMGGFGLQRYGYRSFARKL